MYYIWYDGYLTCYPGKEILILSRLIHCICKLVVLESKEDGKCQKSIQSCTASDPGQPYGKVTKTQENITYRRAKRSAHAQQAFTRLQDTVTTI